MKLRLLWGLIDIDTPSSDLVGWVALCLSATLVLLALILS